LYHIEGICHDSDQQVEKDYLDEHYLDKPEEVPKRSVSGAVKWRSVEVPKTSSESVENSIERGTVEKSSLVYWI
jgi:hypothetical protein